MSALAVTVVLRTIPPTAARGRRSPFRLGGMALISGSLVALPVALDEVGSWGWASVRVVALLVAAAVLMAAFVAARRAG